ncbi:Chromosome transmission fidelity protein 8 [Coemansia spiralis]|nr:Chromosome transmission fidelity protein 8 [Coemansia spiralis]
MSQIRIVYNKDGLREFCLIETQGALELDDAGGLCGQQAFAEVERRGDKAEMWIGVHRAQGSVVKLKKPLAVLKRRPAIDADADTQYEIEAVITEKLLFKARPDVVL